MGTRKFRPTTPSRRAMSGNDFADLTKVQKLKSHWLQSSQKRWSQQQRSHYSSSQRWWS